MLFFHVPTKIESNNEHYIPRLEVEPGPQAVHFAAQKRTMLPPDSFKGKVVFVTGGGTGLGKGMSTKFSELGAKVVIVAR